MNRMSPSEVLGQLVRLIERAPDLFSFDPGSMRGLLLRQHDVVPTGHDDRCCSTDVALGEIGDGG